MRFVLVALLAFLAASTSIAAQGVVTTKAVVLKDASRARQIPLVLYVPPSPQHCTAKTPCPVAFLSQGYGLGHTDYSFIALALARSGYLVVAIQHDLPTDPAISKTGDLFTNRLPMWQRGAQNLRFVRERLSGDFPGFAWAKLVLIGHSNGGDLSALALRESPSLASTLITLDNRRYPLPRSASIRVLSIRGSDFAADAGVLPTAEEMAAGTCIHTIAGSRHNDMNDHGPAELQATISALIVAFLKEGGCPA